MGRSSSPIYSIYYVYVNIYKFYICITTPFINNNKSNNPVNLCSLIFSFCLCAIYSEKKLLFKVNRKGLVSGPHCYLYFQCSCHDFHHVYHIFSFDSTTFRLFIDVFFFCFLFGNWTWHMELHYNLHTKNVFIYGSVFWFHNGCRTLSVKLTQFNLFCG